MLCCYIDRQYNIHPMVLLLVASRQYNAQKHGWILRNVPIVTENKSTRSYTMSDVFDATDATPGLDLSVQGILDCPALLLLPAGAMQYDHMATSHINKILLSSSCWIRGIWRNLDAAIISKLSLAAGGQPCPHMFNFLQTQFPPAD